MKGDKWKLYELIVRRFLATLGPNAEAEITKCSIDVNGETFNADGYVLKKEGWKKYWKKYMTIANTHIPPLNVGDDIDVRSMSMDEGETKLPYRYNQG